MIVASGSSGEPTQRVGGRSGRKKTENIATQVAAMAAELLKDPKRRQQAVDGGRRMLQHGKQWSEKRRGTSSGVKLVELNRRARRANALSSGLANAARHDPEFALKVREFQVRLDRLKARIDTAEVMSRELRRLQYKEIDADLDALEADMAARLFASSEDRPVDEIL